MGSSLVEEQRRARAFHGDGGDGRGRKRGSRETVLDDDGGVNKRCVDYEKS